MKIVLVESNDADREAICSLLEVRKETMFAFDNGSEAWSYILKNEDIDVVITSLSSPGMTGLEICWHTRILAKKRRPVYVVAISDQSDAHMLAEALDCGADDYLQKPLTEEILHARMRVAERLIILQKQLLHLACRDPLTNLYNRRAFFERSSEMVSEGEKTSPISAIMFDIDRFKLINDTYGHDAGDEVIRHVAALASTANGLLGRLGGEEFAILLPNKNLLEAARIADQIRQDIETLPTCFRNAQIHITSSFGVALYRSGESVDSLLRRADLALYKSKGDGRNRVSAERPQMVDCEPSSEVPLTIRSQSRTG